MFLQVTETISKDITFKALLLSIDQVTRYGNMYRDGVIQFKVSLLQQKILLLPEEAPSPVHGIVTGTDAFTDIFGIHEPQYFQ